MANRTNKDAHTVKGTNPQYLIEKIIRMRIYDSRYWKEECFALSAELIVDKGMELKFIGGIYGGNIKPTPFLCLILKLLQIQPDKDIIIEFIRQEDSKYVRALGAVYLRLTGTSVDIYKYLEPLYNDYRKLRFMNREGKFDILYIDELIDQLLRENTYCDIQLPRLQRREALEQTGLLEPRKSALDEDLEGVSTSSDSETEKIEKKPAKSSVNVAVRPKEKSRSPPSYPRRSKSPHSRRRRSRSKSRERDRDRERERDRDRDRNNDRRGFISTKPKDRPDKSGRRSSRERGLPLKRRAEPSRSDRDRERPKDKTRHSGGSRSKETDYNREIREANELRSKLGLAPLQQ